MKLYKCIRELSIPKCDGDGFETGWYIDGTFMDFATPVTFGEALKAKNKLDEIYKREFGEEGDIDEASKV